MIQNIVKATVLWKSSDRRNRNCEKPRCHITFMGHSSNTWHFFWPLPLPSCAIWWHCGEQKMFRCNTCLLISFVFLNIICVLLYDQLVVNDVYFKIRLERYKNDVPSLIEAMDSEAYRRNYEARGWRGWVNPKREFPNNLTTNKNETITIAFSPGAKKSLTIFFIVTLTRPS